MELEHEGITRKIMCESESQGGADVKDSNVNESELIEQASKIILDEPESFNANGEDNSNNLKPHSIRTPRITFSEEKSTIIEIKPHDLLARFGMWCIDALAGKL